MIWYGGYIKTVSVCRVLYCAHTMTYIKCGVWPESVRPAIFSITYSLSPIASTQFLSLCGVITLFCYALNCGCLRRKSDGGGTWSLGSVDMICGLPPSSNVTVIYFR